MEWPLPISGASSPAIQPTSRAKHLSVPLRTLFPLLPSAVPYPLYWVSASSSSGLNSGLTSPEAPSWLFVSLAYEFLQLPVLVLQRPY